MDGIIQILTEMLKNQKIFIKEAINNP